MNDKDLTPIQLEIVNHVIDKMEEGNLDWAKDWVGRDMPYNAVTGRNYRGMNTLILRYCEKKYGYKDNRWLTAYNALQCGGHVRKGEKGVLIKAYKPKSLEQLMRECRRKGHDDVTMADLAKGNLPVDVFSAYTSPVVVFNAEQCEGIPKAKVPAFSWDSHEAAEEVIQASGVPVFNDQKDRAFYSVIKDEIHLPPKTAFKTRDGYYGTALHEVGHSTGAEKRLNRAMNSFMSNEGSYAKEELRAELFSMFVGQSLGIADSERQFNNNAAYLSSWLKALKDDKGELFKAASDAQKAFDFMKTNVAAMYKEQGKDPLLAPLQDTHKPIPENELQQVGKVSGLKKKTQTPHKKRFSRVEGNER